MNEIKVGTTVRLRRAMLNEEVGARGVCYDVYQIGGRPGYGIIFENGGSDGFAPDEVEAFLEVTGECAEIAGYRFRNAVKLWQDFHDGVFAAALAVAKV